MGSRRTPDAGVWLIACGYIRVLVKLGGTSFWKRATPEEIGSI